MFGSACEAIGSTVSSGEPADAALMQNGSITLEMTSRVSGSAFTIRKAQVRPAIMARCSGRTSGREGNALNIPDIEFTSYLLSPSSCHCEERSDEAIHTFLRHHGLLRCPRNDGRLTPRPVVRMPCAARHSLAAAG